MKSFACSLAIVSLAASGLPASHCHDSGADHAPSAFREVLEHYEPIRLALLHDGTDGVAEHARGIRHVLEALRADFDAHRAAVPEERGAALQKTLPELEGAARLLSAAASLEEARDEFHRLSKLMVRWREMSTGDRPVVVYCPMARKSWLQPAGEIGNPYYGQGMARCGKVVSE